MTLRTSILLATAALAAASPISRPAATTCATSWIVAPVKMPKPRAPASQPLASLRRNSHG